MCVLASSSYLASLLAAVWFAAVAVSPVCDSALVFGTVTSQAIGLSLDHGISVLPSGSFPFCRIKFAGSIVAGICARSFHSSPQNVIHGAVSLLTRRAFTTGETVQSPCWLSTDVLVCGSHALQPSLWATASRTASYIIIIIIIIKPIAFITQKGTTIYMHSSDKKHISTKYKSI